MGNSVFWNRAMDERAGTYQFGPFRLEVGQRRLLRGETEIALRLKVFETLRILLENAGRLLTKEELLSAIWPDTVVEENNLNHNISVLRKALGENVGETYIETVPKVGYRFVRPVEAVAPRTGGPARTAVRSQQEIRYCMTSDGVRLAWASVGSGPPLVKASNWLTHLDYEWDSPIWRHWWSDLGAYHRIVRYDERGNGLSQRDASPISFDTWVCDLETVVDAAGLDRFPLLGISRGGSIAIAYAVKHPERVSHLVLYGAFPTGLNHRGTPEKLEARRALVSLMRLGWGHNYPAFCKLFTCRFIPQATPEHEKWFDDLQRISTSAENAARLMEIDDNIDVRPLLPQVRVPTLVVHCDNDQVVSPEHGRQIAAEIPGARYVSLHSANHLLLAEEPAWPVFLEELRAFLSRREGAVAA